MSDKSFAELKEALEDALAYECGERRDLHVTRIKSTSPQRQDVVSRKTNSSPSMTDPKRIIDE